MRAPGDMWRLQEMAIDALASGLARLLSASGGHRHDLSNLSESLGEALAEGAVPVLCVDHGKNAGEAA